MFVEAGKAVHGMQMWIVARLSVTDVYQNVVRGGFK